MNVIYMGVGGARLSQHALVSRSVARKPNKPKKGEPYRMHIILGGDLVLDLDAYIKQLEAADAYGRGVTRTDAIKMLVVDGLRDRLKK